MKKAHTIFRSCRLFILFFLAPFCLKGAEWEVTLKNVNEDGYNTFLYLKYQPNDQDRDQRIRRPQVISINFRKKGTFPIVLSKEDRVEARTAGVFSIGLSLDPGVYDVSIDIVDWLSDTHTPLSLEYNCQIYPDRLSVSDIFLSYQHGATISAVEPILDLNLLSEIQKIHFLIEIYSKIPRQLSLRAILYQEIDSLNSSSVSIWLDINKITRVIKTDNSRTVFGNELDISDLSEGRYLLQIHIYDDDSLLLKPSTEFLIEGSIKQKIFEDLENSIKMMKYVLPAGELNRLLKLDEASRELAFRQAWSKLYGNSADSRMKDYYKRIYAINQRLAQEGEDWQSDRGRIFLQYGEPVYNDITIGGKEYVRWTYIKWDLSFLFEKRNQSYILVE